MLILSISIAWTSVQKWQRVNYTIFFCCLTQNFNYTFFEFFSETLIAFYNVTQKCAFTNAKYQCAFRNWFQMPKKTPNYIVLMKCFNKLMHELFLRHTKSRNTIVKRWEWCWLQSWQGQVAFWSAWLGMFYNISACHQQAWATLWLFIQSGPSLMQIFWCREVQTE